MIRNLKRFFCFTVLVIMTMGLTACGKRTEAVINEGEDITDEYKEYPTLEASTSKKFDYTDLTVGSIKYLMTENEVVKYLGAPTEISELQDEKLLSYNELSVILEKIDGIYKVTQVASIRENDSFSRNLKVGDTFDDILKAYYRDSDYQNNYYKSEDGTAIFGKYLYGQFTVNELENVNTKDEVAYGLLDFNGYSSVETADSYIVRFTYFDSKYKGNRASIEDDFAEIVFELDNKGVITAISWYYYPEENNN